MTASLATTSCGLPSAITCPWLNTSTRWASVMITSMMCSTITSVMPMLVNSAHQRDGLLQLGRSKPASASSSSIIRGPVASTRAISRRLPQVCPANVRAGTSDLRARSSRGPERSSRASPRWAWRRKAPTMTLSSTVMSSNVAGTWKVRPMPARACVSAEARVKSTPSNSTRPVVGIVSPARQLKKVDLPAPFGPISPMISPSATARSAAAHRQEAAESLGDIFRTQQHAGASHIAFPGFENPSRRHAVPQFMHAAWFEPRGARR